MHAYTFLRLTLAFYSLYHFPNSEGVHAELAPHESERNLVYRASGIVILTDLLAIGGYMFLMPLEWKQLANQYNLLF